MYTFLKYLIIFGGFVSPATSIYLENINVNSLKNTNIAYYPGSFDPIHNGHTTVVKTLLDKRLADYVLIYALPDSDTSKNRTAHEVRLAMLESLYGKHPKVLITKLNPAEMQETLSPLFHLIKFSVVLGSDIVNQYVNTSQYDSLWMQGVSIRKTKPEHANTSLGAIMAIPARRVIAFTREGEDLTYVGTMYKSRPITILKSTANADLSSTKARHIANKDESLVDMVPPEVNKIIQDKGLYKTGS